VYLGSILSVSVGPVSIWFGAPSISTCASRRRLVHLKSSALLGSQFSRLFVVNYVSKVDRLSEKAKSIVLVFSVEDLYRSGSNFPACVPIFYCKLFLSLFGELLA